jgi:hypothetical protein
LLGGIKMELFAAQTYSDRRLNLIEAMKKRGETGIIVIPGNNDSPRDYAESTHPSR